MATAKDTYARVTRWFLALQDYRFKVDHGPGREYGNADALSRRDACLWAVGGAPGQVIHSVYHRFPPEGAMDRISAAPLSANERHLPRRPIKHR